MENKNRPSLNHADYGQYIGSMIRHEPIKPAHTVIQRQAVIHEPEPDQLSRAEGDGFVDRRTNPNRQPVRQFDEQAISRAEGEGMVARSVQRPLRANTPVAIAR